MCPHDFAMSQEAQGCEVGPDACPSSSTLDGRAASRTAGPYRLLLSPAGNHDWRSSRYMTCMWRKSEISSGAVRDGWPFLVYGLAGEGPG